MAADKANGVHLVGSIPLSSTEEVFRTVCKTLPGRFKRLPDGETGSRTNFLEWQLSLLDPRLTDPVYGVPGSESYADDQAEELLKGLQHFQTHYEDHALESYAIFKGLRDEGVIPENVRFQVGLPTPVTAVSLMIRSEMRDKVEPFYERAVLESLRHIQDKIPASDLAIQWDSVTEIMFSLGEPTMFNLLPWFEPVYEGVAARFARLVASVADGVEVGLHLCYGISPSPASAYHVG